VLKTVFVPKTDEVTRMWRKLHNGELNNLFSSPNIVRLIKSRKIMWAGHIADIGERKVYTGSGCGILRERDRWEDLDLDMKLILSSIFRTLNVGTWTGSSWLRIGTGGWVAGTCERGNEPSGSTK